MQVAIEDVEHVEEVMPLAPVSAAEAPKLSEPAAKAQGEAKTDGEGEDEPGAKGADAPPIENCEAATPEDTAAPVEGETGAEEGAAAAGEATREGAAATAETVTEAASPPAPVMKKTKKVKRIALNVAAKGAGISSAALMEAQESEGTMQVQSSYAFCSTMEPTESPPVPSPCWQIMDKLIAATAEAKNALEASVYSLRDDMSCRLDKCADSTRRCVITKIKKLRSGNGRDGSKLERDGGDSERD